MKKLWERYLALYRETCKANNDVAMNGHGPQPLHLPRKMCIMAGILPSALDRIELEEKFAGCSAEAIDQIEKRLRGA